MSFTIRIPDPCAENWNAMTPAGSGRHCDSCCKVVVDFTKMQPSEIRDYLVANRGQRVCGHFNSAQLQQPLPALPEEYIYPIASAHSLNWIQKIAAIVLVIFSLVGTACTNATMGKVKDESLEKTTGTPLQHTVVGELPPVDNPDTVPIPKKSSASVAYPDMSVDGMIEVIETTTGKIAEPVIEPVRPTELMGDIEIVVPDSVTKNCSPGDQRIE